MSIQSTIERVGAIRQALSDPGVLVEDAAQQSGGVEAPAALASATGSTPTASFASALAQASTAAGAYPGASTGGPGVASQLAPLSSGAGAGAGALPYAAQGLTGVSPLYGAPLAANGPGARLVAIAESQLGQSEQSPGSNESPAIAEYRSATAGAMPGEPWCAYFASWVARQAGEPLGAQGQGIGSVAGIWSWAQGAGRAVVNGPGVTPRPGDLIVFGDEHVGIVREVLPSGQIATIEGNYENKVAANVRSASEASGYVSMS